MSKITDNPIVLRVAWISAGVGSLLVLVSATWLAVKAQAVEPPPKLKEISAASRRKSTVRRPPRVERPKLDRKAKEPVKPGQPTPPANGDEKRPPIPRPTPGLARPPLPSVNALKRSPLGTGTAGRLSPEELQKRREERRTRQVDRLKNRIKTLEERIASYRKDGTRTEAQIERMERSLDRMRKRLTRMDEKERD